jgi:hypothetical protein
LLGVEARLSEGLGARVWLQEGSTDTAARIAFMKADGRGR